MKVYKIKKTKVYNIKKMIWTLYKMQSWANKNSLKMFLIKLKMIMKIKECIHENKKKDLEERQRIYKNKRGKTKIIGKKIQSQILKRKMGIENDDLSIQNLIPSNNLIRFFVYSLSPYFCLFSTRIIIKSIKFYTYYLLHKNHLLLFFRPSCSLIFPILA